ncbi:MAG: deoxyribodipyrimidine photo-lyase [Desulfonatronovibrionaceae bacterium]
MPARPGPVLYWMSREHRLADNWALVFAMDLAAANKAPLYILFCLVPEFLGAGQRQYRFMLRGLQESMDKARELDIGFVLHRGWPTEIVPEVLAKLTAGHLVLEFDPLKTKQDWKNKVLERTETRAYEVDARNIIPAGLLSSKQEYAARTIRPKIAELLPSFLVPFPTLSRHPFTPKEIPGENIVSLPGLCPPTGPGEVDWIVSGPVAAEQRLENFLNSGLASYHQLSNDPNREAVSNLSPYIHFGHLSPQKVALRVQESVDIPSAARQVFLEQLIIRRELAENFCACNPDCTSLEAAPGWARETLRQHTADTRSYIYSLPELEQAVTHDPLWNAAQMEIVLKGKMHGYMRMYWAKKILEWTPDPQTAIDYAVYLNDRYALDGRDPNGYTGIMWSIAGVHDQGFKERKVYGKIRYMSHAGCKRKFNVSWYIQNIKAQGKQAGAKTTGLEDDKP